MNLQFLLLLLVTQWRCFVIHIIFKRKKLAQESIFDYSRRRTVLLMNTPVYIQYMYIVHTYTHFIYGIYIQNIKYMNKKIENKNEIKHTNRFFYYFSFPSDFDRQII